MVRYDLGISGNPDERRVKANAKATWQRDWKYLLSEEWMETADVNGQFQSLKLPKGAVGKIYSNTSKN